MDQYTPSELVVPRDSRRDRDLVREDRIYLEEDDHGTTASTIINRGSTAFTRPGGAFKSPALNQLQPQFSRNPVTEEPKKFDVKVEAIDPDPKKTQVQIEIHLTDGLDDGDKSENQKSSQKPNNGEDDDDDNDDLFSEEKTLPTMAAGKELNKRDIKVRDDEEDDDDLQDSNDNDELFVDADLSRTKMPRPRRSSKLSSQSAIKSPRRITNPSRMQTRANLATTNETRWRSR